MYEAIGLLEVASIACGIDVADTMVKAAAVEFIDTYMVTPGKYIVLVHGDPSAVDSSIRAGRDRGREQVLASLLIPFVHPQVFQAMRNEASVETLQAIGLIETQSVSAGILAADDAAKAAQVQLVQLHLARGIGGKSILMLTGQLPDVEAAVEAGSSKARADNTLVATRIIPNPHADLVSRLIEASRRST